MRLSKILLFLDKIKLDYVIYTEEIYINEDAKKEGTKLSISVLSKHGHHIIDLNFDKNYDLIGYNMEHLNSYECLQGLLNV